MTEWAPIPDFSRYSVNEFGLVRNDETERVLRQVRLPDGRMKVGLMRNGIQHQRQVSRLVLHAFVPNADPERSNTPIHLDGNLSDCSAYNLAWRPLWFAKVYTHQFRMGYPDTPAIRNLDTTEVYSGIWELVTKYGLIRNHVLEALGRGYEVYPVMQRFDWF